MNSKDKGNLAEAKVLADLLSKQLNVAQPFGDNLPFDLIAIDDQYRMYKVQVKFSAIKNGRLTLRKQTWSSNTKRNYCSTYADKDVDIYAVYNDVLDTVFYVPHTLLAKATFELRVLPAKGRQKSNTNINKSEDFIKFPITDLGP